MRGGLLSLCLVSVLFSACDSTDSGGVPAGADAGAAGENAGDAGDAGAAGSSSACLDSGSGDIELNVTGLPSGVAAEIFVDQPEPGSVGQKPTESTTLHDVVAGPWGVLAKRVYDADPIVRTVFQPAVSPHEFCLAKGGSQAVGVSYAAIPSSNQLWTINGSNDGNSLLGFGSAVLRVTGAPAATTAVAAPVGSSLAFDRDGNLWAGGATVAGPTLVRYAAAMLDGVGAPHNDFAFNLPAIDCEPAIKGIALDAAANVWVSACGKKVLRINKPTLTADSGTPQDIEASVTLSGIGLDNEDLAFDSAGNLWLAAEGQVLRFDKARLAADDAGAPDLALSAATDDAVPQALAANFLAFDASGNLWASDFAGNQVFKIAKADLGGSGTASVTAKVHVTVDVQALMSRPAFDDAGALWLSLAAGKFGKLTAAQLGVSSDAGAPTRPAIVISSGDVGYADGLAFFPAASGLPLASAQP